MNTQRIGPATKLKRGSEHYLNGKPVWVERDPKDGTVFICDDKSLENQHNFWWVNKSDLTISLKMGSSISPKPKKATTAELSEKKLLDAFYNEMGKKIPFNCNCCRKPLYALNKGARRAVTCHILPKKEAQFPELATDPDNILFMGVYQFGSSCNCHTYFDANVESRMKMPIYEYALKRYQEKLRHKLSPAKQQLADEYMGLIKKSQNLAKDIQEGNVS